MSTPTIDETGESFSAARPLTALALLWLAGACLRMTVLAIPPIVPFLHADLHLSETGIGALSSLPTLLFALAAVPGSLLITRLGALRTLILGLVVTATASALRGAVLDVTFLYAATIFMGAGVSIMQPAFPPIVRAWFPHRIALATAVYTNGLLVGEIAVVALTIPFVLPLVHNNWRLSFVFWSLPVFLTALLVGLRARGRVALQAPQSIGAGAPRSEVASQSAPAAARLWWPDWKSARLWRLGLLLGSVNATYFAANAFLPDYLVSVGRGDLISGALTALNLGQLPASFLMLVFAGRLARRPWAYALMGSLSLLSVVGIVSMSGLWIVFWSALLGAVNAVTLILTFALPPLISAPHDIHRTSAGMFTISYTWAMITSLICGGLWDATNLPIAGMVPIGLCAVITIAFAPTVRPARPRAVSDRGFQT